MANVICQNAKTWQIARNWAIAQEKRPGPWIVAKMENAVRKAIKVAIAARKNNHSIHSAHEKTVIVHSDAWHWVGGKCAIQ